MPIPTFRSQLPKSWRLLAGLLVAACHQSDCDCLIPASALISGQVTTTSRLPVAGATVLGYVKAFVNRCDPAPAPSGLTTTAASGQYRLVLAQAAPIDSACVFIQVRPPKTGALHDTLIGPIRLALRYTPPLDSLIVDVTLAP